MFCIADVLKEHHEASKKDNTLLPYLPIPHVRDMLIAPSDRLASGQSNAEQFQYPWLNCWMLDFNETRWSAISHGFSYCDWGIISNHTNETMNICTEHNACSRHRGNTYLTSLSLVRVRHHGRANSVKVEINFTSSASSVFQVYNLCCDKCKCVKVSRLCIEFLG